MLSLALSLSRLLGPQLASAGTFRALKEPLAFLRALELVSSGLCAGRNQQVRRGREGCSRLGSAPSLGGQPLPSILLSPQVPFQDGGDRMEGSGLEAGAWTNFYRRLDEVSSHMKKFLDFGEVKKKKSFPLKRQDSRRQIEWNNMIKMLSFYSEMFIPHSEDFITLGTKSDKTLSLLMKIL